MNRQKAIKERVKIAFQEMLQETAPNLALPDSVDKFCEKFAKATTEIYDSREDPIVLGYIAATIAIGSNPVLKMVAIPAGTSYTFFHNLGYEPMVNVISRNGANWTTITNITDTLVTIYHDHPSGNTNVYRVICS